MGQDLMLLINFETMAHVAYRFLIYYHHTNVLFHQQHLMCMGSEGNVQV